MKSLRRWGRSLRRGVSRRGTSAAEPKEPDMRAVYGCPVRCGKRDGWYHVVEGGELDNLCTYRVDCRLSGLAKSDATDYTRYADDLAFRVARISRSILIAFPPMWCSPDGR